MSVHYQDPSVTADNSIYLVRTLVFRIECWEIRSFIGLTGRLFANGPGDLGSIPGRIIPKTLKMLLDTSLLNTQPYVRYASKWSNSVKGVAPSPILRCSSY